MINQGNIYNEYAIVTMALNKFKDKMKSEIEAIENDSYSDQVSKIKKLTIYNDILTELNTCMENARKTINGEVNNG